MIQALYLHIPFCKARCAYCDFATSACNDEAAMDAYIDALSLQIRRASRAGLLGSIKTIYIGGGTPTHLGGRRLNSLVYLLSLSINLENVSEFTIEANPESIDERMVMDLFALGVNRFSIGVQSFDDAVLKAYGRIHSAADAERAISNVQTREENVSIDLICGGPGQTMASWEKGVNHAIELGVKHVSIYPLMIEDGTPLARAIDAGEVMPPSDDEEADMMERAENILSAAGMHRYEVASYAYPGFESKHNTAYWTGVEYLGVGAGSSSMLWREDWDLCNQVGIFGTAEEVSSALPADSPHASDPLSETNVFRVRVSSSADSARFSTGLGHPETNIELLDERAAALEDLMLGFRRSEGVPMERIDHVRDLEPAISEVMQRLEQRELVQVSGSHLAPTERGWLMGNEIYEEIWGLA